MNWVLANVKIEKKEFYRIMLGADISIYDSLDTMLADTEQYNPATILNEGQWYRLDSFSSLSYMLDEFRIEKETVDYDRITGKEFEQIQYICIKQDQYLCFQMIYKARKLKNKIFLFSGDQSEYRDASPMIIIEECPDAIYDYRKDTLYFKNISRISRIFLGIGDLYREATQEEVQQFLSSECIELGKDFNTTKVGLLNRKRIAIAVDTLNSMDEKDRATVFDYIDEYCPGMRNEKGKFSIASDNDLKLFLYGVDQRFYTTIVGNEKRIANSVIMMNS